MEALFIYKLYANATPSPKHRPKGHRDQKSKLIWRKCGEPVQRTLTQACYHRRHPHFPQRHPQQRHPQFSPVLPPLVPPLVPPLLPPVVPAFPPHQPSHPGRSPTGFGRNKQCSQICLRRWVFFFAPACNSGCVVV